MGEGGLFGFALLVFVVFVSFISLVLGTVSAFYVDQCPVDGEACEVVGDDGKIFEGTCISGECIDFGKIEVSFDPSYVKETIKDRLFDLRKYAIITPFDDIVCDVSVNFPPGSSGEYGGKLKGKLVTRSGEEEIILKEGGFSHYDVKDKKLDYIGGVVSGIDVYRWEIDGWQGGLTEDNDKMEKLVQNGNLWCEVWDDQGNFLKREEVENFGSCVKLFGSDGSKKDSDGNYLEISSFNLATMRTKSSGKPPKWILNRALGDMGEGYHKIDPFMHYKEKFNFYTDLKEHNDDTWSLGPNGDLSDKVIKKISEISECNFKGVHNLYTSHGVRSGNAYTNNGAGYIVSSVETNSNPNIRYAKRAVHEYGHAFCHLDDEYYNYFSTALTGGAFFGYTGANCFGTVPLSFLDFGKPYRTCSNDYSVRTSEDSLMRGGDTEMSNPVLNDWSCGVCRYKILNSDSKEVTYGTLKEHVEFCRDEMDTVTEYPSDEDENIECLNDAGCPGGPPGSGQVGACDRVNDFDLHNNACVLTECRNDGDCGEGERCKRLESIGGSEHAETTCVVTECLDQNDCSSTTEGLHGECNRGPDFGDESDNTCVLTECVFDSHCSEGEECNKDLENPVNNKCVAE